MPFRVPMPIVMPRSRGLGVEIDGAFIELLYLEHPFFFAMRG